MAKNNNQLPQDEILARRAASEEMSRGKLRSDIGNIQQLFEHDAFSLGLKTFPDLGVLEQARRLLADAREAFNNLNAKSIMHIVDGKDIRDLLSTLEQQKKRGSDTHHQGFATSLYNRLVKFKAQGKDWARAANNLQSEISTSNNGVQTVAIRNASTDANAAALHRAIGAMQARPGAGS